MADTEIESAPAITQAVCNDFEQASRLEWLETNHTGAFAMGTVAGVNTRRYHGLLIASLRPPADRYSIFPRIEETIENDGKSFELAVVQYPDAVCPSGYKLLEEFSPLPCPTWHYRCDALTIDKSIRLLDGEQTVVLSYRTNAKCKIQIRLFISFRDYHSLTRQNTSLNPEVTALPDCLSLLPYPDLPRLTFHHGGAIFESHGEWFKNHEYMREMERGLDFREDLYSPGILHYDVSPDVPIHLIATLEAGAPRLADTPKIFNNLLTRALDQFRVSRSDGKPTLIAGYPWFTDWSRDTLISLPAFVASGFPPAETRAILEFLLAERKQGILPNRFSDRGSAPEYNTVDASLWFFIAADAYVKATQDNHFVMETLLPAALDIIDWHQRGTFYGIQVDAADHLLYAGQDGTQLTWMDAKIGDHVVTPRIGKAVEINALWFNALQITSKWALQSNKPEIADQLLREASAVQSSFVKSFWNPERGCLYDVITPSGPDSSLRPNQLASIALPYPLLAKPEAQSIAHIVRELLVTPSGLRTLEAADPNYRRRFEGDMVSRDSAYHQGTVWPWLIGPYVNAYLYAFSNSSEARQHCRETVHSILRLTHNYGLETLCEVCNGEPPHTPGGCPAQLWSVAQTILALQRLQEG